VARERGYDAAVDHLANRPGCEVAPETLLCVPLCDAEGSFLQHTLRHATTHCNTRQHTATHSNTRQHTVSHCNTPQHTATYCNTLQHEQEHPATHCNTLQHTATHCNAKHAGNMIAILMMAGEKGVCNTRCHTLQHEQQNPATHCNTLQHPATHCNTLHGGNMILECWWWRGNRGSETHTAT